jgi:hypothetical protein
MYDATLFEQSREEIYKLMARDNFKRFKASKSFVDFLVDLKPYVKTQKLSRSNSQKALTESINKQVSVLVVI